MAVKKVEKALYGPSTLEVALGAVLGLLAGVACACVYLVFKPVVAVKEQPKEAALGTVYFLPGSSNSGAARGWQGKVTTFTSGGAVELSEAELNAWASSLSGTPASSNAVAKPDPATGAGDDFLKVGGLNVRLEGDRMQVSQKVSLNYFGFSREMVFQAIGGFVRREAGFVFVPERVHLGSCPLHLLPGVAEAVTPALLAKQDFPENVRVAWSKVSTLVVDGGRVRITTQP